MVFIQIACIGVAIGGVMVLSALAFIWIIDVVLSGHGE